MEELSQNIIDRLRKLERNMLEDIQHCRDLIDEVNAHPEEYKRPWGTALFISMQDRIKNNIAMHLSLLYFSFPEIWPRYNSNQLEFDFIREREKIYKIR